MIFRKISNSIIQEKYYFMVEKNWNNSTKKLYIISGRFYVGNRVHVPISVAAQSKAWVCGRPITGLVDSNPAGGMDICLLWLLCVVR